MRGRGDLAGEPPGQNPENGESDGDEIGVNVEDFPDQERRRNQVVFPFHDADEEEIQEGDAKLGEGGQTKEKLEVIEEEFHLGYKLANASRRFGNWNWNPCSRKRRGTERVLSSARSPSLPMSHAPARANGAGTGGRQGRWRARRSSRMNSLLVTGVGAVALKTPVNSICSMDATNMRIKSET